TNGFDDGLILDSEDGTRVPLGRGNFEDSNGSPAFVGRLAVSPRVGLEFGVSAHHGAWNTWNSGGADIDERRDLTLVAIDGELGIGTLVLQGELARAAIDIPPGLTGIYAERQLGGYVDVSLPFGRGWVV